ncbi:MAG: DUF177 domain-containing protein [Hyphomicrobiales bacterium]|nr:DUF177 domain-containing protein [Hyphomicrobiales bacterium]
MSDEFPLSRPLGIAEIPADGLVVEIVAEPHERTALADALDILAVSRLEARLEVARWRRGGVRITGTVEADVEQSCVVTLDPVAQTVREEIEMAFLPEDGTRAAAEPDVFFDPEAEDPPEPIVGGVIDLGVLVAEHVALGLDPYPRKPGAVFEPVIDADDAAEEERSPFAVLSDFKGGKPPDSSAKG